ncbi:MAG: response regulator [Acidobacteriota bacterium]|nr:response regulator [Blastocatellia bacterium]MDW8241382.1 response regulator [Acidobacteriota bacterium]
MVQVVIKLIKLTADLIIVLTVCTIMFVLAARINAFEQFFVWSRRYERWQVDELVTLAVLLLIALSIFSWRGWRSLGREIAQRKQKEAELSQRNQELSMVYAIALASTRDPSVTSIVHNTLAELMRTLSLPLGCIYLKRGAKFVLQSYRGYSDEQVELLKELDPSTHPWLMDVKVVREPIDRASGEIGPWDKAHGIQSWVSVPMKTRNEVIGAIRLASPDINRFTPAELSLITGVASQVTTVLEAKGLEQRLLHAQKMESIGRLAGGVAHDFNNLLTAMTGYTTLSLEMIPEENPAHDFLQELQKSVERAANLNKQLLAFARRQVTEPKVIDLNELILDVGKMLRRLISEDIELVIRSAADPCIVKVDPGQLTQVLVNMAVNARDAMPQGGTLTIETARANLHLDESTLQPQGDATPAPYVLLTVSDTGTGMTEEVKEHLFEPFFTTKEKGKGTGLGLATCYGIVKQNNGHIQVQSELGEGTTFRIYFPEATEKPVSIHAKQTQQMQRGVETILLVEDEPSVRELASHILRQLGYTVLEAESGEQALSLVQQREQTPIHLLLSDVVMPRMSGRELMQKLHALRPELKVLLMSGYADEAVARHGVMEPGVAFLQKPFSPEALASKVREILDRQRAPANQS